MCVCALGKGNVATVATFPPPPPFWIMDGRALGDNNGWCAPPNHTKVLGGCDARSSFALETQQRRGGGGGDDDVTRSAAGDMRHHHLPRIQIPGGKN